LRRRAFLAARISRRLRRVHHHCGSDLRHRGLLLRRRALVAVRVEDDAARAASGSNWRSVDRGTPYN
jgi:hypothetical protein